MKEGKRREGERVAREEGGWCVHVYLRDCIFTISPHVLLRNKGDVTLASITAAAATQLMDKVSHMYMYANLRVTAVNKLAISLFLSPPSSNRTQPQWTSQLLHQIHRPFQLTKSLTTSE